MYVAKELAVILSNKGFVEDCGYWYTEQGEIQHCQRGSGEPLCRAPTEHQVIDWVFKPLEFDYSANIEGDINFNYPPNQQKELQITGEWLQFWYTTLLEHKFSLMYEFIGRLEDWFENHFISPRIIPLYLKDRTGKEIMEYSTEIKSKYGHYYGKWYISKQRVKNEAILKCFKLLKDGN